MNDSIPNPADVLIKKIIVNMLVLVACIGVVGYVYYTFVYTNSDSNKKETALTQEEVDAINSRNTRYENVQELSNADVKSILKNNERSVGNDGQLTEEERLLIIEKNSR